MAELTIGHPNEKQERFFIADQKYIAYGGARGGGKSWALRIKLILLALNYDGIQMLLLRRTYPELQENHIVQLKGILHDIAIYHSQEKVFIFPNGSRLKMGYCKREDDVLQFQGQAYDVIAIDEATHFTEFQFQALTESNRASGLCKKPFSPRMYLTCNPGGVGHHWVKRLFVDKNYTGREIPENYNFIPALVYDNKAFLESDPEYVAVLEALPEKRRRAMLYGDWNAIEGAFFDEFMNNPEGYKTRVNTHVIDPFDIPDHWNIYRSYDHGFSRPFSMGYWTVDPNGVIYRIAEYYGCTGTANEGVKLAPQDIFRKVKEFETSHPYLKDRRIIGGVADPSIWNASSGKSVAEHAADYGIYFTKGDNKRVAGWMEMRNRLATDSFGKPGLYFFSNCKAAIRTVPIMMYGTSGDPEDLDTDMEDHVCDEIRYFCMSRPMRARVPKTQQINYSDPLMAEEKTQRSWNNGVI
jgi:phage terminase large subunit